MVKPPPEVIHGHWTAEQVQRVWTLQDKGYKLVANPMSDKVPLLEIVNGNKTERVAIRASGAIAPCN